MSNHNHHSPPRNLETPHDTDAEAAVISCALQFPARVVPVIKHYAEHSELFFSDTHSRIWTHLEKLYSNSQPIDLVTVQSSMSGSSVKVVEKTPPGQKNITHHSTDLETIGGPTTLYSIQNDGATEQMFPGYLSVIRELQIRRDLITKARETIEFAHQRDTNLSEILISHTAAATELKIQALKKSQPSTTATPELLDYLQSSNPTDTDRPPLFVILDTDRDEENKTVAALRACSLFAVSEREILNLSSDQRINYQLRKNWLVIACQHPSRQDQAETLLDQHIDHCPRIGQTNEDITQILTATATKKKAAALDFTDRQKERITAQLHYTAELAKIPDHILYSGLVWLGERGGLHLHEDILARRTSKTQRLGHIGGEFWEWNTPEAIAGQPGTWTMIPEGKKIIAHRFREIIRRHEAPGGIDPTAVITGTKIDSVVKLATSDRPLSTDVLNRHDPMLINTKSGMVHALNNDITPHREEHYSTTQVPVILTGKKRQPANWISWLNDQQPSEENRRQLQEIFGYCLVPAINYHKFFFWHGDGGSGKTTAANVLIYMIGEKNVASLKLEDMDEGHVRQKLVGKPLYYVPEVNAKTFVHDDMIKSITSGDPVDINPKYGTPFSYRPKGRLLLTSNLVAHSGDTSLGFMRRFLQINWENVISEDKKIYDFEQKYFLPELPQIFQWSIEGFRRLYERGRFEETTGNREAHKEFLRHRAQVKSFISDTDWITDNPADRTGYTELDTIHQHYIAWCEHYGVKTYYEKTNSFSRELTKKRPDLTPRKGRPTLTDHAGYQDKKTVFYGIQTNTPTLDY